MGVGVGGNQRALWVQVRSSRSRKGTASPPTIAAKQRGNSAVLGDDASDSDEELVTGFDTDDFASSEDEEIAGWMRDVDDHDEGR